MDGKPFRFSARFASACIRLWVSFGAVYFLYAIVLYATDPPIVPRKPKLLIGLFVLPGLPLAALLLLERTSRAKVWLVTWAMKTGLYPTLTLVFLFLVGGEIYFRLDRPETVVLASDYKGLFYYQTTPDAEFVYRGQLYGEPLFDNRVRLNGDGFHDVDHEPEKAAGTYRIAFVGDSMVEALHVPREEIFHRLLEDRWNGAGRAPAIETLSFGRGGFGQHREMDLIEEHALGYRPDLVVCCFYLNDVGDTPAEARAMAARRSATVRRAGPPDLSIRENFLKFVVYLELDFTSYLLWKLSFVDAGREEDTREEDVQRNLESCLDALEAMRDRCREAGSDFLVLSLINYPTLAFAPHRRDCSTWSGSADPHGAGLDLNDLSDLGLYVDLALLAGLAERGIDAVFVAEQIPRFPEVYDGLVEDPIYLGIHGDPHFGPRGHEVVSRILEDSLVERLGKR